MLDVKNMAHPLDTHGAQVNDLVFRKSDTVLGRTAGFVTIGYSYHGLEVGDVISLRFYGYGDTYYDPTASLTETVSCRQPAGRRRHRAGRHRLPTQALLQVRDDDGGLPQRRVPGEAHVHTLSGDLATAGYSPTCQRRCGLLILPTSLPRSSPPSPRSPNVAAGAASRPIATCSPGRSTTLRRSGRCVWDFFDVVAEVRGDTVLADEAMPGADWFPGTRLNLVDQVFRDRPDAEIAIHERDESGRSVDVTWAQLRASVASVADTLREHGVGVGDRVVAYLPNSSEAVVAFLATASLGAVWSACGMDYAPTAALGRFAQLDPVVLFAADGYRNGGRVHDRRDAVAEVRAGLPSLRATIAVDRLGATLPDTVPWEDACSRPAQLSTTPVDFAHPLWVLFSSGTTGLPKGIVHGHGGVLLEHLKAVALQSDLGPGDRFWWYTTPSWMMWNFQVAGLLVGATIVCYDGSPAYPNTDALWALAAELRREVARHVSPAYLAACAKAGVEPGADHDLSALRTLGVTGSTLPTPSFHWVAEHVGASVQIASITGGTDVVTAFAGGAPSVPGVGRRDLDRLPRCRARLLRRARTQRARRGRRARHHPSDAVDAGHVLERPGRHALPRRLLRHLSRRLASR